MNKKSYDIETVTSVIQQIDKCLDKFMYEVDLYQGILKVTILDAIYVESEFHEVMEGLKIRCSMNPILHSIRRVILCGRSDTQAQMRLYFSF